jgi:hypothetical protein
MILATFYYFAARKSIPMTYFTYRHNAVIIIATLMLALIIFTIAVLHGGQTGGIFLRVFVQLSMLLALIYILPVLLDGVPESKAFEESLLLVCYIFALQGGIHLAAYLIPPFGDFMISIKPGSFQAALADPSQGIHRFRGYALSGSIFFELPSAYGAAFILFMRLQLIEGQKYLIGYKRYIVFFLIFVGIMLTGRVGYVGIGIGTGMYFLLVKNPIAILGRIIKNAIAFLPVLLIVWFFLLSSSQRKSVEDEIFPYSFEFYYKFKDTGRISTGSSDATFYAFYFPLRDETLLWGHGTDDIYGLLDQYAFTDSGYMRSIMFGGIPFLICLLVYQFLYFSKPIKAASRYRDEESRKDRYCFIFLFVYILVLHIKDYALALQHLTEVLFLYTGFSYLIKYYAKLEK